MGMDHEHLTAKLACCFGRLRLHWSRTITVTGIIDSAVSVSFAGSMERTQYTNEAHASHVHGVGHSAFRSTFMSLASTKCQEFLDGSAHLLSLIQTWGPPLWFPLMLRSLKALPFTLLPQGEFLIVNESGISQGDIHHSIASLLFSHIGSFFSSFFPLSHLATSSTSLPAPILSCPGISHLVPSQEVSSSPVLVVSSHHPILVVSSHRPILVVSSHRPILVVSSCSVQVASSYPTQ